MKDTLVRICVIELKGFKNTQYGLVEMPATLNETYFSKKADVLGIYGQNGSGKTAVIEAMEFVQKLLTGGSLGDETVQYISKTLNHCSITITFVVTVHDKQSKVEYTIELKRTDDDNFQITGESLSASAWSNDKFERKKTLLCFSSTEKMRFTPLFRYQELVSNSEENKINFAVAYKIAQKEHRSFIFNHESRKLFLAMPKEITADYADIIHTLYRYARVNLFVISNVHSGSISMNLMIPFTFRLEMGETITKGDLPIRLDGPSLISKKYYEMVQKILSEMNIVLHTLIPGLSIEVYNLGEQLLENGQTGYRIQLVSKRGEVIIPLKYESEGIIKIISVLNALVCIFNAPSMCLIIDELDAGIYEYLLGELLSAFQKSAKGQLIFTSHNLRALEMLHKSSIVFSTANPKHRYMRLQNVKTNNNLRDLYLRSITLGGQKEEVYAETDTVEIGRAFRRAGRAVKDGGKN